MAVVNKAELARLLKVSLPTLTEMMARHGDFPVVRAGDRGVGYEFDLDQVTAFLQRQADEAEAAGRARDALLAQFTLPGIEPPEEVGLSPQERFTLARTRALERQEQREAGFLVETTKLRPALADTLARLSRAIDVAVRQTLREANIPEPVIRQAEARLAEAKRRAVAELTDYLGDDHAGAEPALV